MSKYRYEAVDDVLGSYFSEITEQSDDEAIAALKNAIVSNPDWADKFLHQLRKAFADPTYAWLEVFEEHQIPFFDFDEIGARKYALSLFLQIDPKLN
jgi:hypothetical protein